VIVGSLAARLGKDEAASKELLGPLAAKVDATKWSYPIVRYLRGEVTESELLAQAVDDDKRTDAHGYLGFDAMLRGQSGPAMEHFRWVRDHGNPDYLPYTIALAELDRAGGIGLAKVDEPARRESLRPVMTSPPPPAAEPSKPAEPGKATQFAGTVIYVPTPEIETRFGADPKPLADYINALKARTESILSHAEPGTAHGLLVAVGLKANRRSKVWCQAVEGELPRAVLRTLEQELADIEPVALSRGPAALGLKFRLYGRTPKQFPEAPSRWVDAAQASRSKRIIPPDDVFGLLWPE
jgi:hypothetical protein